MMNDFEQNQLVELPYVIFYVKNIPDLLVFYKQAFNLSPSFVHESGHFAELISGVVTLAFRSESMAASSLPQEFQSNHLSSPLQAFEVSFHTKDVHAVYERAIKAGATNVALPHIKPWGQKAANVRDPAGILIEITEYPKGESKTV
ncbi:MAG: VOC family protein [Verrucomicrobia bacterium]|nr:VOC family protein [Verrucomicrobiota bacterium]